MAEVDLRAKRNEPARHSAYTDCVVLFRRALINCMRDIIVDGKFFDNKLLKFLFVNFVRRTDPNPAPVPLAAPVLLLISIPIAILIQISVPHSTSIPVPALDYSSSRFQDGKRCICAARGRPIIVEWERRKAFGGPLSRSVTHRYVTERYTFSKYNKAKAITRELELRLSNLEIAISSQEQSRGWLRDLQQLSSHLTSETSCYEYTEIN
ncbi:hypothetical protein EVAR_94093_1 [Eumeta japonica]|uniref:Uncharacterized protein n=1 Tax=Eumeta variegata TaxID=151549 RepID=A0A4C1V623_EUMVA|nr:hypothetical protein EVAR_94093_1 [Eumeta japonica]